MQPEAGEGVGTRRAARLGDLTFVMREDEVFAARVNVDRVDAELAQGHRRTFDVPAGVTGPPGGVPLHDVRGVGLPEHEVGRVFLDRLVFIRDAAARPALQVIERIAAQLAVVGEGLNAVVDDAVGTDIGMAPLDEPADHRLHRVDLLGRFEDVVAGTRRRPSFPACGRRRETHRCNTERPDTDRPDCSIAPSGTLPDFLSSLMRCAANCILSSPAPSATASSVMWPTSVMFMTCCTS